MFSITKKINKAIYLALFLSLVIIILLLPVVLAKECLVKSGSVSYSTKTRPLLDCGQGTNTCNPGTHWKDKDLGLNPFLALDNLEAGQIVRFDVDSGTIDFGHVNAYQDPCPDCCRDGPKLLNGASANDVNTPKFIGIAQFTDSNNQVVSAPAGTGVFYTPHSIQTNAILLKTFEQGIAVPENSKKLFVSYPDSVYADNSGYCSFSYEISETCQEDYCGNWGENYCKNGEVYSSRTCYTSTCESNGCSLNSHIEEKIIEDCDYGCENEECNHPSAPKCSDGTDNDNDGLIDMNDPGCESPSDNDETDCYANFDCGTDHCVSANYCRNNNVYQNFSISKCNNPGTNNAFCSSDITPVLLTECGENSCQSWGSNFCKNNNVYHSRTCTEKGCSNAQCFADSNNEEALVEDCDYGCENGQCNEEEGECTSDSQCSDDYYGNNYCYQNNVYRDKHDFSCDDNECKEDIIKQLVQTCELGCSNGQCNQGECTSDSQCSDDYYGNNYCSQDNVYRDKHDFSCDDNECKEDIIKQLVNQCELGCSNGQCNHPSAPKCSDGTDNDNDGLIDMNDPGCESPSDNDETDSVVICCDDSECGEDGLVGENYCYNHSVYKDFKKFSCVNPGLGNSECIFQITPSLIQNCGEGYCGEWEDDYCRGSDVYHSRTCTEKGCSNAQCFAESHEEEELDEECEYGCSNGRCKSKRGESGSSYYSEDEDIALLSEEDYTANYTYLDSALNSPTQKIHSEEVQISKIEGNNSKFWIILILALIALAFIIILIALLA